MVPLKLAVAAGNGLMRDGTIVYADISADYRQHPDPCEIVPLLREMSRAPG